MINSRYVIIIKFIHHIYIKFVIHLFYFKQIVYIIQKLFIHYIIICVIGFYNNIDVRKLDI